MKIIQKFQDIVFILFVIILSFWAIAPLLQSGFFPMHDNTQVARIYEMGKALKDGMFPVRWVSDLGYGYGYPLFNFYAPLAYYFGGLFIVFGANALFATKITFIVGIIFSGVFMYLLARSFFDRFAALVSAVLYMYATYHAVDIYVRGDLAEFFAYAIIPLAFYGLWKAYETKKWNYITLGAFSFAAIVISHNLTALMISPFFLFAAILLTVFAFKKHKKGAFAPLFVFLFGILLSSFYWLPVFSEMKYTNIISQIAGGADYKNNFVCLSQFWYSQWGFGGSAAGCNDGMSFMIGKIHIIFAILGFIGIFLLWKNFKKQAAVLLFAAILLVFAIFLSIDWSMFIWKLIPQMAFLQYPWRFLVIISFAVSLLGGGVIFILDLLFQKRHPYLRKYGKLASVIIAVGFILFFQKKFFVPQSIFQATSDSFTNTQAMWDASKTSDEYMPKNFKKPVKSTDYILNPLTLSSYRGKATQIINKTQVKVANIQMYRVEPFILMQAYFPAWHLYVDGKEVSYFPVSQGLLVTVPFGNHTVMLEYKETSIEVIGNLLSLAGMIGLILGIIYSERKFSHDKTSS